MIFLDTVRCYFRRWCDDKIAMILPFPPEKLEKTRQEEQYRERKKKTCSMVAIWPFLKWFGNFLFCFGCWRKQYITLNLVKNLAFIRPFFIFEYLAFFETASGQIWPFNFFRPGNPDMQQLLSLTIEWSDQLLSIVTMLQEWLKLVYVVNCLSLDIQYFFIVCPLVVWCQIKNLLQKINQKK